MYTNHTLMFELARARQHDLLAQAAAHRRARQARQGANASQPRGSRPIRRAWQLLQPRRALAQAQS